MYEVSEAFKTAIKSRSRSIEWWGTITLTTGEEYDFTKSDIVQGSGTITRSCSSQSSIDIGGVYAAELQIQLRLDIDRYKLSDARILVYSRINHMEDVQTWGDALPYSWSDMQYVNWGDDPKAIYTDVPMGVFEVSEALRAVNSIKITAYDYMLRFDETLPDMGKMSKTPFEWIRWICTECGVLTDVTSDYIRSLPNGKRTLTYADVNNEVKTYRDLLSELTSVLGAVAQIDRFGKLIVSCYTMNTVDTIDSAFRYTSDFSDYQTYYTGLTSSYRAKAVQEYYRNVHSLEDTGLVMDVGYNVFLQITSDTVRNASNQAIINAFKDIKYTPFNVTMPFNPIYDPMDVLLFTDNQTAEEDIAPITSITFKVNDHMTILCSGENPKMLTAQTKENKAIEGLNDGSSVSGTMYASGDFWIQIDSYPEDTVVIPVGTATDTTEVTFTSTVENTRVQILWTGCYTIDEDARVVAMVYSDDSMIYGIADDQTAGMHSLTISTGHEYKNKGEHKIRIVIREDIPE